ncbi:Subtilisin-like protease [Morus notabilis]|uniref:Subtilisin-like protease n=1 Tax=Morus notabilis TaxID=981085 RepID=W9S250_9ROSA|nr:Subtilisin-like protease [Morus notabilis]
MSLGGRHAKEYHSDNFAIAAFAATEHGILISASAGNSGPHAQTLANYAHWMTTIGARTIITRKEQICMIIGNDIC